MIAYCRIGERSSHTWFVLRELLGYANVRNYDGSWTSGAAWSACRLLRALNRGCRAGAPVAELSPEDSFAYEPAATPDGFSAAVVSRTCTATSISEAVGSGSGRPSPFWACCSAAPGSLHAR